MNYECWPESEIPQHADCGGRIQNPYYLEWMNVRQEVIRLEHRWQALDEIRCCLFPDIEEYIAQHDKEFRLWLQTSPCLDDAEFPSWNRSRAVEEMQTIMEWTHRYIYRYSWAIPNDDALLKIAQYPRLVEIGAGTGYWASLLRDLSVDILAFDSQPPSEQTDENAFHPRQKPFTEVLLGDESELDSIDDRDLFLCWPPPAHPMACNCLKRFRGNTLLFIGEESTATGDDEFHHLLDAEWTLEHGHTAAALPTWPGKTDFLWIYHRK